MNPSVVIFDVDKTLALSKQAIQPSMAVALAGLLKKHRVGIISGDSLHIIEQNVISQLPPDTLAENLYILPTSGAALYVQKDGAQTALYAHTIPTEEKVHIEEAIRAACTETGLLDLSAPSYGERIEYRGAQITLSALGQEAPIEEKEAWDPDGTKKRVLRDAIAQKLPDYDVKTGGSTSVDVTQRGINKAYGVRQLSEYLSVPTTDILYVGDALYPHGNDEVVKETGVTTRQVSGPEETLEVIKMLST